MVVIESTVTSATSFNLLVTIPLAVSVVTDAIQYPQG